MEILPSDYIAGFVDGEDCFALKFRRDVKNKRRGKTTYFYWNSERERLKEIQESMKKYKSRGDKWRWL